MRCRLLLLSLALLTAASACSAEQTTPEPETDAGLSVPTDGADAGSKDLDAGTTGQVVRELTLAPQADAHVIRTSAGANFGSALVLEVDADASGAAQRALLRFAVPSGAVVQARLRLWVVNGSSQPIEVHRVTDTSWGEMSVTWANQPPAETAAVAQLAGTAAGTWVEVDVTSAVVGQALVTLLLAPASEDGFSCASREDAAHAPRLLLAVRDEVAPVLGALEVTDVASTTATITWTTDEPADSQLEFGTSSELGQLSMLDARRVMSHRLVLEGLTPGTAYHFRATSSDAFGNRGVSASAQFKTPSTSAWTWIAYGDTRTNDAAHRKVLRAMKAKTPSYRFMINVGDVVEFPQRSAWETWKLACEEELGGLGQTQVPPAYMSAPGNHEQVGTAGGLALWKEFLPGQAAQFGHDGRWFRFDYENARFVVLDTNLDTSASSAQTQMLMDALTQNPKTWTFLVWHNPIFDFGPKSYEAGLHADWGVPIYQHGGDLIFTGHAHYYVRSKKLALGGQANPPLDAVAGVAQVVTGNGGVNLVAVDENEDGNGYMVDYSFDQGQAGFHGYTELLVDGSELTLRHIRTDGKVMDTATYTANAKK